MRLVIIVILAVFWIALAYREYSRGNMAMAGVFLLAGSALTVYRLRR